MTAIQKHADIAAARRARMPTVSALLADLQKDFPGASVAWAHEGDLKYRENERIRRAGWGFVKAGDMVLAQGAMK